MNISKEQLQAIEKYSSQFFSIKEIAQLIDVEFSLLSEEILNSDSKISRAYYRGKLLSEAEIRESILKMAKLGSAVAQTEALKLISKQKLNEIIAQ